jgi:hypothetical protein
VGGAAQEAPGVKGCVIWRIEFVSKNKNWKKS